MIKSKSFWGGITGLVGAVAGYMTGEIELGNAISIATTSILAIFVRHGISKVEKKVG
tara:strand:- start:367 stop:537 length:171 start_codon:yes stop_codon:yes gene_type:complete